MGEIKLGFVDFDEELGFVTGNFYSFWNRGEMWYGFYFNIIMLVVMWGVGMGVSGKRRSRGDK